MPLRDEIEYILGTVVAAREEELTGHPLAIRLRGTAAEEVRAAVADDS